MKRTGRYAVGLILIAAAAAAILLAVKDSKSHDDQAVSRPAATSTAPAPVSKACRIFTLAEAKTLLGDSVKGGPNLAAATSADLDVSTCTYTQSSGSDASVSARKAASLLARVPKTDKGVASNDNEFGPLKPTTVQDVDGYGDHAYWDAEHGQLNILKNNDWYVLSYGSASPADRSLDQTRQLADLLIDEM